MAHTNGELAQWAKNITEKLREESGRALELHREGAQASREAALARKEVLSLKADLFNARKEVYHD